MLDKLKLFGILLAIPLVGYFVLGWVNSKQDHEWRQALAQIFKTVPSEVDRIEVLLQGRPLDVFSPESACGKSRICRKVGRSVLHVFKCSQDPNTCTVGRRCKRALSPAGHVGGCRLQSQSKSVTSHLCSRPLYFHAGKMFSASAKLSTKTQSSIGNSSTRSLSWRRSPWRPISSIMGERRHTAMELRTAADTVFL